MAPSAQASLPCINLILPLIIGLTWDYLDGKVRAVDFAHSAVDTQALIGHFDLLIQSFCSQNILWTKRDADPAALAPFLADQDPVFWL